MCSARAARLIQVPIIHTKADMGGLGEAFERALVARFGERLREDNQRLVDRFWTVVEEAVDRLPVRWEGTRLYQDGLPVCGREMEIVSELARAGSRNHQLLVRLSRQGAVVMGTESAELLVEEYQLVKQMLGRHSLAGTSETKSLANDLLERRDRYIAGRINGTLREGETGVIFLGLLHRLENGIAVDIKLVKGLAIN